MEIFKIKSGGNLARGIVLMIKGIRRAGSTAPGQAGCLALLLLVAMPLVTRAQLVPQIYSANDFLSMSSTGQPLTNAITLQPWPPTTATTIAGLNFVAGPPQTLTPANGTNFFYLYPNYYRMTWAGLPYATTFAVLPGTNVMNIASEAQSGAAVFWGTNNFQYQVVVDTNDTTPGTLSGKIVLGTGGFITTNNVNGNEQLVFNFSTNLSTFLSAIGFTNAAMAFAMNSGGFLVANTNGGMFQIGTNCDIFQTNRLGGSFGFRTNSFYITLPASNSQLPASLLLSNGIWTVSAGETVSSLMVGTNLTIGSATLASGPGAIVFTNGTQPNINIILTQVSPTLWTNTVFGFSVSSNGQWNYLNSSGQTMWTLTGTGNNVPIGNPWTIGPSGFGSAPGSSPVTVQSGTLQENGQIGMTNLTASGAFTGTFNGAGTISNAVNSVYGMYAANATNDSNGRLLSTAIDTNLFTQLSQWNILVSPYTNLPAQDLTNPFYFSPALGSNYVQLAVNSLPNYGANRLQVGGGKIIVVGQNFYSSPMLFTNVGGGIMNFDLEAPFFGGGALICATNPAIRAAGYNRGVNFTVKNLIVASLVNQTTNLVEIGQSATSGAAVGKVDVENNWLGYWTYLTNNSDIYGWAGLTPPTTGGQIGQRNLVFYVDNGNSDMNRFVNNSFLGMQSVYLSPDHCDFLDNFFSYCGGSVWASGTSTTAWPTNAAKGFGLGAALILGNTALNENQWHINNTHFYGCYAGYYSQTTIPHIVFNSYFEDTTRSELGPLPIMMGSYWAGSESYSAPPMDIITNASFGVKDTLVLGVQNLGNQGTTNFSIPFGDGLQLGDLTTLNILCGAAGFGFEQEDQNTGDLLYGFLTNAPPVFQTLTNASGGYLEELMLAGTGDQTLDGNNGNFYLPILEEIFNTDGSIIFTNRLISSAFFFRSNSISSTVPFTGSLIGNASYATNAGGLTAGITVTNVTITNGVFYGALVPTNGMGSFAGPMVTTNGQGQLVADSNGGGLTNVTALSLATYCFTNAFNSSQIAWSNACPFAPSRVEWQLLCTNNDAASQWQAGDVIDCPNIFSSDLGTASLPQWSFWHNSSYVGFSVGEAVSTGNFWEVQKKFGNGNVTPTSWGNFNLRFILYR